MEIRFTSDSFPQAVRSLFEENSYDVVGPKQVHGAEIDLIASSKTICLPNRFILRLQSSTSITTSMGKI